NCGSTGCGSNVQINVSNNLYCCPNLSYRINNNYCVASCPWPKISLTNHYFCFPNVYLSVIMHNYVGAGGCSSPTSLSLRALCVSDCKDDILKIKFGNTCIAETSCPYLIKNSVCLQSCTNPCLCELGNCVSSCSTGKHVDNLNCYDNSVK